MRKLIISVFMSLMRLIRRRRTKSIYFSAFQGQYSDSQRAISEKVHEMAPDIVQIWRHDGHSQMPPYVLKVASRWEYLKAMAQADAWVMEATFPWKDKDIFSVAVWHGDRGFKKVLYDSGYPCTADFSNIDLFTAGSDFGESVARSAFRYGGYVQKEGLPRNDRLVNLAENMEYAAAFKSSIGLQADEKVLLFAPTYRDSQDTVQSAAIDIPLILDILERDGEHWKCLVRAHAASKGLSYADDLRITDISGVGDMADFLLVSDMLISDYSSCACDFVLTGRPCILAQLDRAEYESNSRSFYMDIDSIGFLIARTEEELEDMVRNIGSYDHESIAANVNAFYGTNESGKSAGITAGKIIDWINCHHS